MSVSFWHESYGTGLRTPGGRKSAFASWQADGQQRSRDLDRAAYYGGDSKFFGGNGYGGGLCEFGHYDIEAGSQCHNGGQYRNNNYGMAFKPCRNRQRQCFYCALKPSSFTPVLALIGVIFYMFCKNPKKKDTGMILLSFATLMSGMETMSGAVSGLRDVPSFQSLFVMFKNPAAGVLAGAVLTAVIQSSSASVGILQALAVTGQVTYGAAVPIIMGQNIGTCVTAMISSVGANKTQSVPLWYICCSM